MNNCSRGLCALILAAACGSALADYQPPSYPQTAPALKSIAVQSDSAARAGGKLNLTLTVEMARALEQPARFYVHLLNNQQVLHVADLPVVDAAQLGSGQPARLAPRTIELPADLPGGEYQLVVGMQQQMATGEAAVKIDGPTDVRRLIINTGKFMDKFGVPHYWYVNKAHTLFWDGEPFIPVGGMLIPDENLTTFKAQIDMLIAAGIKDVYFNVGSSVMMPHTWETKGDDKLRLFQNYVDYMDEKGMRYGMEPSGLQAHCYAYDLNGGKEFDLNVDAAGKPKLDKSGDDQWIADGQLNVSYKKISQVFHIIYNKESGQIVQHGKMEVVRDERPGEQGRKRGDDQQIARVKLGELKAGEYKIALLAGTYRETWGDNMLFWSSDTPKYYQAIRDLYGKIRMGPGFRFIVDAFWNENNMHHSFVPAEQSFIDKHEKYLSDRYGTIEKLRAAWAVEPANAIADFKTAANLVLMRPVKNQQAKKTWQLLVDTRNGELVQCRDGVTQIRYDIMESVSLQVRDYHNEIADLFKEVAGDAPVIFKNFSGSDMWHINNAGISGGFDGLGMETYGVAEPMLTFMAINALGECQQATKTMWLLATEIGEGNHMDQALSRNKMFGCTSRLGTAYGIYSSLLAGGAKGLFHYYMVPSPGADRFWEDALMRDPRQLEWLGTLREAIESSTTLADYVPKTYYRFPALLHPNSGLLFSDPYRDYYNTDTAWWVDPAGKLTNGAWMLPTFTLDVPTDLMMINLENTPATLRFGADVETFIKTDPRLIWLGFRKDLGAIPSIDRYYTETFAKADDGIEIQVLQPPAGAKIIGKNKAGQVWNFMVGNLQIISKSAANVPGWRPDRPVLDDQDYHYDYWSFMKQHLGIERVACGEGLDGITYTSNDQRVTVVWIAPPGDSRITLGPDFPPFSQDWTANVAPPADMSERKVSFKLPAKAGKISAAYASGEKIDVPTGDTFTVGLTPDNRTLLSSGGKFPWAREGLLFNTADTRSTVIFRTSADADPVVPTTAGDKPAEIADAIVIEAERPSSSNWNLGMFSGLSELSGDAFLGLATASPPPAPDGYAASYEFEAPETGVYQLWVREGILAMASPARWRVDDAAWREAGNSLLLNNPRIATLYNALEDERMLFGWYHYGNIKLPRGKHTFTYSIVEKRPARLDIGLANNTPYGKLVDCFVFTRSEFVPDGRNIRTGAPVGEAKLPPARINLVENPSLEVDTGGWSASELTEDRWKLATNVTDHHGGLWWTQRVGGEGHFEIRGLMNIGGFTVRQSFCGVRSIRIRAHDKNPRRFSSSRIAVSPGTKLVFGGYGRAEKVGGDGAVLQIRFLDRNGQPIGEQASEPLTGTTHWNEFKPTLVEAPANVGTAILDCQLAPADAGTAWFDDLYVYRK